MNLDQIGDFNAGQAIGAVRPLESVENNHNHALKLLAGNRIPPREDLVTQTTEQLKQQILSQTFVVGSELPSEGSLAAHMGVSRTVIREAMRNLRSQGLITVTQGRRPQVKAPDNTTVANALAMMIRRSTSTCEHLMEVRLPLETEIAALAAERRTDDSIDKMRASIELLKSAANVEARIAADIAFHTILSESAGNPVISMMIGSILPILHSYMQQSYGNVGIDHAVVGHTNVMLAVQRRDPKEARAAMVSHLADSFHDVKLNNTPIKALNKG
jgi:GntR family transcriptional repressor for pyruvate dehydrogenase complex